MAHFLTRLSAEVFAIFGSAKLQMSTVTVEKRGVTFQSSRGRAGAYAPVAHLYFSDRSADHAFWNGAVAFLPAKLDES